MKNLIIYYFTILLPFPFMIWAAFNFKELFVSLLVMYIFYRGFTDFSKLKRKKIVTESEKWKFFFIPFYSSYYMKELYFEE